MRSLIVIGLSLFITYCSSIKAETDTAMLRDPFEQPYLVASNEQADIWLKQIQIWQFKGKIVKSDNHYQQIWLASQDQWLAITDDIVPNMLFPWRVQSILTDKIVWQANLPEYCHDEILWTMPLNE